MAKAKPTEKPWGLLPFTRESLDVDPGTVEYLFEKSWSYYQFIEWIGCFWADSRSTKLTKSVIVGVDYEAKRPAPRLVLTTVTTAGRIGDVIHLPMENLQALKDAIAAAELMMVVEPEMRKP